MPRPVAEEMDLESYVEKPVTDLQSHLNDWILDKTGYEPKNEEDFLMGVKLATALRMAHQASPENEERREALAAAREKAVEEADVARAEKSAARKAKAAEADDDDEEAPKPKRRGRPAKAKAEPEEDEEAEEAPAPKRAASRRAAPARRTAAKAKVSEPAEEEAEEETPRKRTARAGRRPARKTEAPF